MGGDLSSGANLCKVCVTHHGGTTCQRRCRGLCITKPPRIKAIESISSSLSLSAVFDDKALIVT